MMIVFSRASRAAVLGLVLALSPLLPARAQEEATRHLNAALRLYDSLEYERALEQLAQARRRPRKLQEDVRIALLEGLILSDMGRREEARVAFTTGLMLEVEAALPVRTSPKVEREFERLRTQVRQQLQAQGPQPPPAAEQAAAPTDRPEASPLTPQPPDSRRSWLQTPVRVGGLSVSKPTLALLGAGVVAGGVGGLLGLRSREQLRAAREAPFQDALAARHAEAQGSARVANVLFGAAGLLATSAAITWLLSSDEGAAAPEVKP